MRAHFELAETLEAVFRPAEAHRHRVEAVRRHPLVVMPCAGAQPEARILVLCSAGRGDVSVKFLLDPTRFEKRLLFLLAPDDLPPDQTPPAPQLPSFDILFNAIADPDRGTRYLGLAATFCAQQRPPRCSIRRSGSSRRGATARRRSSTAFPA